MATSDSTRLGDILAEAEGYGSGLMLKRYSPTTAVCDIPDSGQEYLGTSRGSIKSAGGLWAASIGTGTRQYARDPAEAVEKAMKAWRIENAGEGNNG